MAALNCTFEGIQLVWDGATRRAAIAVTPFRPDPGSNPRSALAYRLEETAAALRAGDLMGADAVEQLLWACAGYAQGTQVPPAVINVGARTIADDGAPDDDVPSHQVGEDEDPVEQGF
jgi:hypothetical protein